MDLMRRMPAGEKLRRALEYSAFVRDLAETTLRRKYPNASEREIFLRAARQRLGNELFEQVYGNELPA
jgi:hypothetical protein